MALLQNHAVKNSVLNILFVASTVFKLQLQFPHHTMNDSASQSTFTDTKVFGGIYFGAYMLVFVVIIAGTFYFAGRVRLYYESYKALQDIEKELNFATLGIKALEIKCNVDGKGTKPRKKEKVSQITIKDVKCELNKRFSNIDQIIQNHKQQLTNRVDKIQQIKSEKTKDQKKETEKLNKPDENEFGTGLVLSMNIDDEKDENNSDNETIMIYRDNSDEKNEVCR